ncbi:carboxypeptidase-like regulatory domain-containing protein, partial [Bacteroides uniformis]
MDIHFKKLLLPILALFAMTAHAQSLSGLVTDEETGQPLEAVMISVLRNGTMIDYALTDARGRYSLPWKYNGNLQVSVSLLGYRREIRNISAAGTLHIRLHPEAIALKEVQIRPGRIHGRKDTVRYNLAEFASSKDIHIKDVLKKLPGVDIDDNGQVKYKGKAIDHYFVEGMDVTGGRYSQINNNLSAKAVKSAEIMENYQSVKALKGKLSSDEIALNLKLDPQARDQWIVNGTLGAGWSDGTQETTGTAQTKRDQGTLLWENAANALQLGKGKQSIYGYKSNNNGTDLSREQHILTNNTSQQIPLHGFLVQPGISAPLDKQRLLFNETHTLNANRMYKWNDERSLRLQAGYTHNRITQQRGNSQVYYQPDDTIRMDEAYHYCLQNDAAHMEMHYEDNKTIHYLSNRFLAESETNRGTSHELQQTMRTSQFTAKNFFSLIRNGEKSTWKFNSATQYAYLPSSLSLHDGKDKFIQHSLYNDNKASHLRKHNGFTRQYTAGIKGEWASVKYHSTRMETFGASSFSPYLSSYFQLEQGKWQGSLSLPLSYKRYFSQQRSFLFFNPSLYLRYQPDYHWKISLYGSLHRSAGDVTDLCPFTYRTDYRTWKNTDGLFPVSIRQQYNLYGEYKNTVQEFFATATLSYRHVHYNTLNE